MTQNKIIHVIAAYMGESPLYERQELCLGSVDKANKEGVVLLAASPFDYSRDGWEVIRIGRDSSHIGDETPKPFIKDLYDLAMKRANPGDWLLYINSDCAISEDFYQDLHRQRASVMEYIRQDVKGDPQTLDEVLSNDNESYRIGVDGLALRAQLYGEIRDCLPDFVVGEPHWDTIYSEVLRKILPVKRDTKRLFHPLHDTAWDLSNPTAAGENNHTHYVDSLNYGSAYKTMITEEPNQSDTAVITVTFGDDPERIRANALGIEWHLKQDLFADYYLTEMVIDSEASAYPDEVLGQVNHLSIQGDSLCGDLFQKEALMNYAWRKALEHYQYDYFIFVDADVYCTKLDWFRQIRARLHDNPSRAVQGFRIMQDTKDPALKYSSVASAYALDQQTDLELNPGTCWGLHRSVLEMGGGFNAFFIDCAGDSAFVAEYLNSTDFAYDQYLFQFEWYHEIIRNLPYRAELDCVPYDIQHVHHGALKMRNYDGVRYAIDGFPPVKELVAMNGDGLLRWKNEDCPERQLLRQRAMMRDREAVDKLFAANGYQRFKRHGKLKNGNPVQKEILKVQGAHKNPLAKACAVKNASQTEKSGIINIFNPTQVFREDFPFSWCCNVRTVGDSPYIPFLPDQETPMLDLDGDPDAPYIVGMMPLHPSWEPINTTVYSKLHFTIQVRKSMPSGIVVQLISKSEDGNEHGSGEISLTDRGLQFSEPRTFSIQLSEFEVQGEFKFDFVKMVKFVGYETSQINLSGIYLS